MYMSPFKKSKLEKLVVIGSESDSLSKPTSYYFDTNISLKFLEVQKRSPTFENIDSLVITSKQSMKLPIPLPTSALNLLEYIKLLI